MDTVLTILQNFGFPVACVIAVGWFSIDFVKRVQDDSKTREEKLMNMITACGKKLEQITLTLGKLSENIENLKQ